MPGTRLWLVARKNPFSLPLFPVFSRGTPHRNCTAAPHRTPPALLTGPRHLTHTYTVPDYFFFTYFFFHCYLCLFSLPGMSGNNKAMLRCFPSIGGGIVSRRVGSLCRTPFSHDFAGSGR